MEQFNPGIRHVLLRLAETATSDAEIVHDATQHALDAIRLSESEKGTIDRLAWSALPISLQRATLRALLLEFHGELTNVKYTGIEEARDVLNSPASHAQIAILASVRIVVTPRQFKRTSVLSPSDCLLVDDTMPKDDLLWSSSSWWPLACMDPQYSGGGCEGVCTTRHRGVGVIVFTDSHAEARKDKNINPPRDPASGDPAALVNSKYWDPLRRAGNQ